MRHGTWMALAIIAALGSAMGRSPCRAQAPVEEVPGLPEIAPGPAGPPPPAAPPAAHGAWGRGISTYVPDATGRPNNSRWVVTQGGVYLHQPKHPQPPCQRPTSICIKPKIWTFSQAFYQLHHEVWYGVTDPCWLMDPDCCGTSCQHQNSFGLIRLFPWAQHGKNGGASGQQCSGAGRQPSANGGCNRCGAVEVQGPDEVEGEEITPTPTPAEPPVEHPQAAQRGPVRSVLLKRE